ncbi:MAG: 16S rRNA (cytosine(1402)-N(4))-methyltransferase RsmH [Clostridiales bacterium]|nr:16S rRNA (cytosine(1402)-N(4))-methyltransferase RsmH [Clostridiales bacterium]
MEYKHYSVLANEATELLVTDAGGVYVDCTLGGAGHTSLILKRLSPDGRIIGIDRDSAAVSNAENKIHDPRFTAVKNNYENLSDVLDGEGIGLADGFLFDLGVSSYQLDTPERGFSYMSDAPLDMRMDTDSGITARDVVNGYPERELARILYEYGEEKLSRRIAARICAYREKKPIETTSELASIIEKAVPDYGRNAGHPAKRSFQAIRIEVNGELESVGRALESAASRLKKGGRIVVISFHSLEDRIVKTTFARLASPCTCPKDFPVCVCGKKATVRIITKHPVLPSEDELKENSRSHSAKLRAVEGI